MSLVDVHHVPGVLGLEDAAVRGCALEHRIDHLGSEVGVHRLSELSHVLDAELIRVSLLLLLEQAQFAVAVLEHEKYFNHVKHVSVRLSGAECIGGSWRRQQREHETHGAIFHGRIFRALLD